MSQDRIIERRGDATVAILKVRNEQLEFEIAKLRVALEEIAKAYCSNCWSYPCTNSPAIARKALAKEGK